MSGTEITLSIKKDEDEFLSKYRIEEIVKKYSDFVPFPIFVTSEEDKKEKKDKEEKEEQVNSAEAIWLKDKNNEDDDDDDDDIFGGLDDYVPPEPEESKVES